MKFNAARKLNVLPLALLVLGISSGVHSEPINVLFVGNSYTHGRVDPVLSYNAANVFDLTRPQGPLNGGRDPALAFTLGAPFTNLRGTNSFPVGTIVSGQEESSYSPHYASSTAAGAWGGVPGIFDRPSRFRLRGFVVYPKRGNFARAFS